jgi:hypothetical protein
LPGTTAPVATSSPAGAVAILAKAVEAAEAAPSRRKVLLPISVARAVVDERFAEANRLMAEITDKIQACEHVIGELSAIAVGLAFIRRDLAASHGIAVPRCSVSDED